MPCNDGHWGALAAYLPNSALCEGGVEPPRGQQLLGHKTSLPPCQLFEGHILRRGAQLVLSHPSGATGFEAMSDTAAAGASFNGTVELSADSLRDRRLISTPPSRDRSYVVYLERRYIWLRLLSIRQRGCWCGIHLTCPLTFVYPTCWNALTLNLDGTS